MSTKRGNRQSINTCHQCRSRKVKCDAKRDTCGHCQRLGFACSFRPRSQLSIHETVKDSQLLCRRRVRQACLSCHSLKARCNGESPRCHRCRLRGTDCVYQPLIGETVLSPSPATLQMSSSKTSPQSAAETRQYGAFGTSRGYHAGNPHCKTDVQPRFQGHNPGLPSRDTVMQAIDKYFCHIHPLTYFAFLHKASVVQGYVADQTDPVFIFALCGLTYGILESTPEIKQQANAWVDNAEKALLSNLDQPSIFKVLSILLIVGYKVYQRSLSSAYMWLGIAARFAFAMRLNYEDPSLCFLAQESRRRVMWAIYILDTRIAGGLREFTVCPVDTIHVQLPCKEEDFELDNPQSTGSLKSISDPSSSSHVGLLAQYIRVMDIRDRILRYTRQAAMNKNANSNPHIVVGDFEMELQRYATTLPNSLAFSIRNLHLRAYSVSLPRYIMIHVCWHQCYCDLYRLLFAGLREAVSRRTLQQVDPDLIAYCQSKCVEHARAMSVRIFASLLELEVEPKVMDVDLAVYCYQSARIIVHAYRSNAEKFHLDEDSTRAETENCAAIVKKMCLNSPLAGVILQDIEDLLAGGILSQSASEPNSPSAVSTESIQGGAPTTAARARQVMSRHGFAKQSSFLDDSARLVASLDVTNTPRSASSHQQPASQQEAPSSMTGDGGSLEGGGFSDKVASISMISTPQGHEGNNVEDSLPLAISQYVTRPEGMEADWANNTAYQGAWGESQPFFDPLSHDMYYQDDWDMRDFMQGK